MKLDLSQSRPDSPGNVTNDCLEIVRQGIGSLRYGMVEIVVHDSQVIQIKKTERVRLEKSPSVIRSHRTQ